MTSRADVEQLRMANAEVTRIVHERLGNLLASINLATVAPELVRDALLDAVPALVSEYGDVAASAAAQWYEEARAKQVAGTYRAVLADRLPEEQIAQSVRWAVGPLWDGNVELASVKLFGAVQRHISDSARRTVARNTERDPAKPRMARVPRGVKTCAFCLMLASRGFAYHSKQTAGGLMKFHDDCDCQIVTNWSKDGHQIDGYDPDALARQYQALTATH